VVSADQPVTFRFRSRYEVAADEVSPTSEER
jgi:hypothetical protein